MAYGLGYDRSGGGLGVGLAATFIPKVATQPPTVAGAVAPLVISDRVSSNAGAGHWYDRIAGAEFFGVTDSVRQFGYNVTPGGVNEITSEPALYDQWESDYYQNGTEHMVERHGDYVHRTDGLTTIAVASNGQVLPQGTINVASTTNFPSFGELQIGGAGAAGTVQYTGKTGTTFTGCTGGTRTLTTGMAVLPGFNVWRHTMIQISRDTGLMTQFEHRVNILTLTDWITAQKFASLQAGALNFFSGVGNLNPGIAIGNDQAGGTLQTGVHSHLSLYDAGFSGGPSWQLDTLNGTQTSVSLQGIPVLYFFKGRGLGVNVQDNTAGLTVTAGGDIALVSKFVSGATAGDLARWQQADGTTHIKITQATSSIPASLVVGKAVLANAATDGFVYLPTVAGTPTGTPTAQTGTTPVVYDTTANKLWVYNGAWKSAVFA